MNIEITPEPRRRTPGAILGRFAFLAGLAAGLAAGWLLLPSLLFGQQRQPLDFDHALHTGDAGLACADCHDFRADGSFAGIPPVSVCEECHAEPLGESPDEQRLVDQYIEPGREIPWLVYARQPQNVYFSHAAHVELAAIDCALCHGAHGASSDLPVHEVNRISTYARGVGGSCSDGDSRRSDSMKMNSCSGCHAQRGVRDHCLMCHK